MEDSYMGGSVYIPDIANIDTDFIGFTFNGIHSSTYNIYRTSNGSRFEENLLPEFTDTTESRSGMNGTFYFGSNYTKNTFNINIAYDNLTEKNLRQLRSWLNVQSPVELIFDELPYRVYYAKTSIQPKLNYICFFENNQRIYKGEGTISFNVYETYARQSFIDASKRITSIITEEEFDIHYKLYKKFLKYYRVVPEGTLQDISNTNQWSQSSGMLEDSYEIHNEQRYNLDIYEGGQTGVNGYIDLYNPGDMSVPFKLYLRRDDVGATSGEIIKCSEINLWKMKDDRSAIIGDALGCLKFSFNMDATTASEFQSDYFVLNSNNRLIEGYDTSNMKTGEILNNYITNGDFFLIPPGKTRLTFVCNSGVILAIEYAYYYI